METMKHVKQPYKQQYHYYPQHIATFRIGIDLVQRFNKTCINTSLSPPAPSSKRAPPMASISSKNMMHAFLERAISKSSRTIRAPSPTYFCTSSEPMTRMKQASVLFATARAHRVFPEHKSNDQKQDGNV